jgi:hypothetical protein
VLGPIVGEGGVLDTLGIDAGTATKFLLGLFAAFLILKGVLFVVGIVGAISSAVTFLTGVIGAVGGGAGLLSSLGSLVGFLSGPVGWALIAAVLAIKALIDEYGSWQGAIDAIKENFTGSGTFGSEGIIVTAIKLVVENFLEKIEELKSKFFTHLENISETITSTLEAWKKTFDEKVSEIRDNTIGRFQETDWGSVGKNIIEGIASGISGAVGALKSAVTQAANDALAAAKAALGINSPAKVPRKIVGHPFGEGMALGVLDKVKEMQRAVTELIDAGMQSVMRQPFQVSPQMDFGGMTVSGMAVSGGEPALIINIDARDAKDPQDIELRVGRAVDRAMAAYGRSADRRIRMRK